ncbi:hypothetical protein BH11GEM2_BH11GEM2_41590 [soil metagenome]
MIRGRLYRNPLINIGATFLEPLSIGPFVALVSAGVLSRRRKGKNADGPTREECMTDARDVPRRGFNKAPNREAKASGDFQRMRNADAMKHWSRSHEPDSAPTA